MKLLASDLLFVCLTYCVSSCGSDRSTSSLSLSSGSVSTSSVYYKKPSVIRHGHNIK